MSLLSNSVECPVCLKLYSEPRILTNCGHTFCHKCISRVTLQGLIRCPLCAVETPVLSTKNNYALQELLETLASHKTELRVIFQDVEELDNYEIQAKPKQVEIDLVLPQCWACCTMSSRRSQC